MKFSKPNIIFGNSNLCYFESLINIFNIKQNYIKIKKFKDKEYNISLKKKFLGKNIFIFLSLSNPIHNNIIKLILIIDLIKTYYIKNIYLIIPYFCYSRQDKYIYYKSICSIKTIIKLIESFNFISLITLDPHNDSFNCFFNSKIKILQSTLLIVNDIIKKNITIDIIVSPDLGGINRAKNLANYLNLELTIIDKRRPILNNVKIFCIIGNVELKHCLIIDDIIDTCNSIIEVSNFLLYNKALNVRVFVTHAIFSNNSYLKIINSNISELIITDTINNDIKNKKIRIISTKFIFIEEIKKKILLEYEI